MKSRVSENRKVTLTIGQLKKLVRESISDEGDFEIKNGVLVAYHGNGGDVVIPDKVRKISAFTFDECGSLKSVTIPDSVRIIDSEAFSDCLELRTVVIGKGVKTIGGSAFAGCSGLTSITIPDSVTSIGDYAFSCCTGLTSLTIPESVMRIGSFAFTHCTGLTSITILGDVKGIMRAAFDDCPNLDAIYVSTEQQRFKLKRRDTTDLPIENIIARDSNDEITVMEADDDDSSPAGSDNCSAGSVRVLFRTKPFIDDKAGEVRFPSIDAMVRFLEDIGVEYTAKMADAVAQGKMVQISLPHTIVQLGIQRQ